MSKKTSWTSWAQAVVVAVAWFLAEYDPVWKTNFVFLWGTSWLIVGVLNIFESRGDEGVGLFGQLNFFEGILAFVILWASLVVHPAGQPIWLVPIRAPIMIGSKEIVISLLLYEGAFVLIFLIEAGQLIAAKLENFHLHGRKKSSFA